MNLNWQKVNWFSKLLAAALFAMAFGLGLLLGTAFQPADADVSGVIRAISDQAAVSEPMLRTYDNQQYQFRLIFPDKLWLTERQEGDYFALVLTDPTSNSTGKYNYPPSEPFESEEPTAYDLTVRPTKYKTVQEFVYQTYKDRDGESRPVVTYTTFAGVQAAKVDDPISFGGCLGNDIFLVRSGYEYRIPSHDCFGELAAQINSSFAFIKNGSARGWKTYRNNASGFEIMYPPYYAFKEFDGSILFRTLEDIKLIAWSLSHSRGADITIVPREKSENYVSKLFLPEPMGFTEDYFSQFANDNPAFNVYVGRINMGGRNGFQFLHSEFGTIKYTLLQNEDGTFFDVSGWLPIQTDNVEEAAVEPYDTMLTTLRFTN